YKKSRSLLKGKNRLFNTTCAPLCAFRGALAGPPPLSPANGCFGLNLFVRFYTRFDHRLQSVQSLRTGYTHHCPFGSSALLAQGFVEIKAASEGCPSLLQMGVQGMVMISK